MDQSPTNPSARVKVQIDVALLEERVREEIARQLRPGKPTVKPMARRKVNLDHASLREAVRMELHQQLGIARDATPRANTSPDSAIETELLQTAIRRALARRVHRHDEAMESGRPARAEPEVTPALLEPLVRKELDRLLNKAKHVPHLVSDAKSPDSALLRERIQEEIALLLRRARGTSRPHPEAGRITPFDREIIAEQVRAVLHRCLSRPALPEGRPLSDHAIDEILKGALRELRR